MTVAINKKQGGFSLFESLIAIGLLSLILTVGGGVFFLSLRGQTKALASKELRQGGSAATLAMEDYLNRFAKQPSQCLGTEQTFIDFIGNDGKITTFHCLNNHLASNSAYLTPDGLTCSQFKAHCTKLASSYPQIYISFTMAIGDSNLNALQVAIGSKQAQFSLTKILPTKI